ncbi:class I SAM-dependent methyltransferase [Pseudomonas sp. BW13M1]|uniref:Class I SAM-dependent methyltransferase n=1 Tax=Pseudomonas peradeniyensis TaxID=2745488 RepID=A0A923JZ65_9PSED|nr:class I SAM-dependent methyltransferase [Pseudomonas peradeniyensis]MBV4504370.1 class I SAM-dependent methyltransferase [Pseudomonas peradeniyensis]
MSIESGASKDSRCPVCVGDHVKALFNLKSPYIDQLLYQIRHCDDCGHRFAAGPVTEQILSKVYDNAFHASSQQQANGPSSAVMLNAVRRAQWLSECGLQGRLLDVGAGRGYFVKAAQDHFDTRGIDYSANASLYGQALGVTLDSGDFTHAHYAAESFDVLTFWDVLASMIDVHATLSHAARLLRPGGHIALTVPMGDSLTCRLANKRWPLWIPPVNLHYFSKKSLERLMHDNGFEIVRMECQGKRVSLNFLLVKLARSLGLRSLEQTMAKLPLRWAVPINLGDIQTVLVRRRQCAS